MPESERILIRAFNLTNIKEVIIMTVITQITIAVALVLSIILPFGYYLLGEKSRGRYKTALGVNAFFFFGIMLVAEDNIILSPVQFPELLDKDSRFHRV